MISTTPNGSITTIQEYVEEKCGKYIESLDRIGTELIPTRSRNPWITPAIIESIKFRNMLLKYNNKLGKIYKSKIVHLIKVSRENYFKNQINIINKNNPRKQWELLYYF